MSGGRETIDLGRHAGDRCVAAVENVMALVDDPIEKAKVALMALGMLAGTTGAAFAHAHSNDPEVMKFDTQASREFTCAVLDIAKEIVRKGADKALIDMSKRRRRS